MKKTVLIIILSVIILLLGGVLYLFIETSPKQIKDEVTGTMYTFDAISFDLLSSNYIKSEKFLESIEERDDIAEDEVMVWVNEEDDSRFIVMKISDTTIFEDTLIMLNNPRTHIFVENETAKTLHEYSENMQEKGLTAKSNKFDVYNGSNKIGILNKITRSDNSISYSVDIRIDNSYYTFLFVHESDDYIFDNIMEFLKTVNIYP